MKNYYENTINFINEYNRIMDKMMFGEDSTTEDEDEFITNTCIHLAHSLIKDVGTGQVSRIELCKTANVIKDVCEE